jgi:hypothetical protein
VCSGGACIKGLSNGSSATDPTKCLSGIVADAVCCDRACGSDCEACTGALKGDGSADGTCAFVADRKPGRGKCSKDSGYPNSCKNDGTCNGAGARNQYAEGGGKVSCGTTSCSGTSVSGWQCNGGGVCAMATNDCAPFRCNAGVCTATCTSSADCTSDGYCDTASGKCLRKKDNGEACSALPECKSGLCVDGFCCVASCTGQCESCGEKGSEGNCLPITGTPRGSKRAPCVGAGTECGGTCNGIDTSTCTYEPTTRPCGAKCADAKLQTCDGRGACGAGAPCGQGYACDGTDKCFSGCTDKSQCAVGYDCQSGKCAPAAASCTNDRATSTSSTGAVTQCSPVLCDPTKGLCGELCKSELDCVAGLSCNSAGACVQPATASSGGCGVGGGEAPMERGVGIGIAALALAWAARRSTTDSRRRRRPARRARPR